MIFYLLGGWHENILRYFDVSRAACMLNEPIIGDDHFIDIAIDLADCDLNSFILDYSDFDQIDILRQLTCGVTFLHSMKIIHQNLKPEFKIANKKWTFIVKILTAV